MSVWIDTHCHLNEDAFTADRSETIERALAVGVSQMLVVGFNRASSLWAVELAEEYPAVYAVVGIQPNYVQAMGPEDFAVIRELAQHPKVVGLGETGLDQYWDHAPLELQTPMFRQHLELSRERGLPFVVHCRDAEAETVAVLQQASAEGPLNGVMHSFAGSQATAEACLACGLHLSFSGMLTFKRNEALRQVAANAPLDRIMVETDAPYLTPSPMERDKRNEPAHVRYTANRLAEIRGMTSADLAAATTANARRLFRLPG